MTREEKEHIGKYILEVAKLLEDGCYQQEIFLGAAHIIDEALEQEPILDKIRAEIVELQKEYQEYGWAYDDVLEIIDKYKVETEG